VSDVSVICIYVAFKCIGRLELQAQFHRILRVFELQKSNQRLCLPEMALAPIPSQRDDKFGIDQRANVVPCLEEGGGAV